MNLKWIRPVLAAGLFALACGGSDPAVDLERASRYVGRAVAILAEIGVDQSGVLPEMWQSGAW